MASLSLCNWLYELIGGGRSSNECTYGCIREIFESRYFRGEPNDLPVAADAADDENGTAETANVYIKSTELQLRKKKKRKQNKDERLKLTKYHRNERKIQRTRDWCQNCK